mmetsp:Transcript_20595/g.41869  ORF Transcript_20595/g.41869 Transcript_20595/m.41869 type:complete len:267 (+) Transcript_20595:750-1550(+)
MRLQSLPQRHEAFPHRLKVGAVTSIDWQLDVDIGALALRVEIAQAVQRVRRHARLASEDDCAAVALMHVQVADEDAAHPLRIVTQRHHRGDGNVVEDAVALSTVAECVVRPAGDVAREARPLYLAHGVHGGHRAPCRRERSLDGGLRPREADAAVLERAQFVVQIARHVMRRMHSVQIGQTHERRLVKRGSANSVQLTLQGLSHEPVFAHRERGSDAYLRQVHFVQVVEEERHGRRWRRRQRSEHAHPSVRRAAKQLGTTQLSKQH